MNIKLTWKKI